MARLRTLPSHVAIADTFAVRPAAKVKDPHYNTPDHRAWSQAVIERAGGVCQCRGCAGCSDRGCRRTGTRLFADHIVELADGGAPFDMANGQAICGSCHTTKTAKARADRQKRWS